MWTQSFVSNFWKMSISSIYLEVFSLKKSCLISISKYMFMLVIFVKCGLHWKIGCLKILQLPNLVTKFLNLGQDPDSSYYRNLTLTQWILTIISQGMQRAGFWRIRLGEARGRSHLHITEKYYLNPSNTEATFIQCTMTQRLKKKHLHPAMLVFIW